MNTVLPDLNTEKVTIARTRPLAAFVVLCAGRFMVMLDLLIVVLALPAVQAEFKVPSSELQWVFGAYALTFGGFLLLAGKAGDLFGRRRLLIAGFALFCVASLAGGLSRGIGGFIVARAFQGLGAALISPNAFALVTTLFPDQRRRSRAIGIWSALSGIAFPAGGLLGGLLVAGPGWRWVMFVNVPFGALAFLLSFFVIARESLPRQSQRLDFGGAATATLGLVAVAWVASEGPAFGWFSPITIGIAAAAVGLLVLFVALQKRVASPLVRFDLLRNPGLAGANVTLLLGSAGLVGALFTLSFFFQRVVGIGSAESGLAFVPTSLVFVAATLLSPRLSRRLGTRGLVVAGAGAMALGDVAYSLMGSGAHALVPFLVGSFFIALFGLALPQLFIAGVVRVGAAERGIASGMLNTSQQIGGGVGLAVVTAVEGAFQASNGHSLSIGLGAGFLTCAGFLILALVFAVVLIRRDDGATAERL